MSGAGGFTETTVTEMCGCGAWVSLPDTIHLAMRLRDFRQNHRCLPVPADEPDPQLETSVEPAPAPIDPQPTAVTGTVMPQQEPRKVLGFV